MKKNSDGDDDDYDYVLVVVMVMIIMDMKVMVIMFLNGQFVGSTPTALGRHFNVRQLTT